MKIIEIFSIFYIKFSSSNVFYTDSMLCFALATFQVLHCDTSGHWTVEIYMIFQQPSLSLCLNGALCLYLSRAFPEVCPHLWSSGSTMLLSLNHFSWSGLNGLQLCAVYLRGCEQAASQCSRWLEPSVAAVCTAQVLVPRAACHLDP